MKKSRKNTPINYQRVAVCDLRALPIRENPRLKILDYRPTSAPGMVGKPRTHGYGAALVADGYVVDVCLTRIGAEWFLEIERRCYDEQATGRTETPLSSMQLAGIYRGIQKKHYEFQYQGGC